MKKIQRIWKATPAGIVMPTGSVTDISDRGRTTLLRAKTKSEEIEALYSDSGLALPPQSDLAALIVNAKTLWEKWFINKTEELQMTMLFKRFSLIELLMQFCR